MQHASSFIPSCTNLPCVTELCWVYCPPSSSFRRCLYLTSVWFRYKVKESSLSARRANQDQSLSGFRFSIGDEPIKRGRCSRSTTRRAWRCSLSRWDPDAFNMSWLRLEGVGSRYERPGLISESCLLRLSFRQKDHPPICRSFAFCICRLLFHIQICRSSH